jgi:hypothetical protein
MKPPMAGWIVFTSVVMLLVGTLAFFEGLIAVIRKHYFVLTADQLIVFDMTTWGWITLAFGVVITLAGLALLSGAEWARCSRSRSRRSPSSTSSPGSARVATRSGRS